MNFVEPDIDFIDKLTKDSGAPLKQCMQCGACTVVCELSPEENPFPRKEMIWASWGLKDKLMADPDIWLCHQCGDCSATCPRDVRPGDVLSSIRNYNYQYYARPRFLFKLLKNPWLFPVVFSIPIVIIHLILFFAGTLHAPEGPVNYSKFFPHMHLNISFSVLVLLIGIGIIISMREFWKDLKLNTPEIHWKISIWKSIISTCLELFSHRNFRKCSNQKFRFSAHFMVFWGFMLLLLVTLFAILSVILDNYPLPFLGPIKMIGNLAALMLIFGLLIMIFQRIFNRKKVGKSKFIDWVFLASFFFLTITGVLTEIARFQNWSFAYSIYTFHLTFVWYVIIYAPYTKFAHVIYRMVAMIYSKRIDR